MTARIRQSRRTFASIAVLACAAAGIGLGAHGAASHDNAGIRFNMTVVSPAGNQA